MADLFVEKETGIYGKGLFAKKLVPKGTIFHFVCKKCSIYSKEELARLPKDELEFTLGHEITNESGQLTNSCDKRILYINHSCNANTLRTGKGSGFDIVVKDIQKGEQATSDYRIYCDNLHFTNGCKCGEPNCMKGTTSKRPSPQKLQKFWDGKINAALKQISYVKQPLKMELLKEHPELSYLFEAKPAKHIKRY